MRSYRVTIEAEHADWWLDQGDQWDTDTKAAQVAADLPTFLRSATVEVVADDGE